MNQLRKNNRKSMRLKGYDYSHAGLYFITICTKNREHIFGIIKNEKIILNENGNIVRDYWNEIPNHYNIVELDEYIVMPNHVHGIIRINPPVEPLSITPDNKFKSPVGAQFIAPINMNTPNNINTPNNQFPPNNRNASNNRIASNIQTINKFKQDAINRTPTTMVGNVVRSFKARCTHAINKMNNNIGISVWQRNYYEHIIRNEKSYHQISEYIKSNSKIR